jgi:single-strand DNA-binding protein
VVGGIAFGETAKHISRLKAGDALSVSGSLKPSSWTDKVTDEIKYGLSINAKSALSIQDSTEKKPSKPNPKPVKARSTPIPTRGRVSSKALPQSDSGPDYNDPILF